MNRELNDSTPQPQPDLHYGIEPRQRASRIVLFAAATTAIAICCILLSYALSHHYISNPTNLPFVTAAELPLFASVAFGTVGLFTAGLAWARRRPAGTNEQLCLLAALSYWAMFVVQVFLG